MPATLSCTISKIATIPNKVNATIITEYYQYMRDNGASERHQNNALKAVIAYAKNPFRTEFGDTMEVGPNLPKAQKPLKFNVEWGH
jgi:hypothetical protein